MKKFDHWLLLQFHKVSNWVYSKSGIDNYLIATILLVLTAFISIGLGIRAYKIASLIKIPELAQLGKDAAKAVALSDTLLAIMILYLRKDIARHMTKAHDLERKNWNWKGIAGVGRWTLTLIPVLNGYIHVWYSMADLFLLGLALWFLCSPPPNMELRMKKAFSKV